MQSFSHYTGTTGHQIEFTKQVLYSCSSDHFSSGSDICVYRPFTPQISSKNVIDPQATGVMKDHEIGPWLLRSHRRQRVLKELDQPMTATQLNPRVLLPRRECSDLLHEMSQSGLLCCLNPDAIRSRVYGLTEQGKKWREKLWPFFPSYEQPETVDWQIYGLMCFSHRLAVITSIDVPMNPAAMKRQALRNNPDIRMSANNVRDIIPILVDLDILYPFIPRKGYIQYTLTRIGFTIKRLLLRAADTRSAEIRYQIQNDARK